MEEGPYPTLHVIMSGRFTAQPLVLMSVSIRRGIFL